MSRPLFAELETIEAWLKPLDRILLFLDFDGTLSPIVPDPDQAELIAGMSSALSSISQGRRARIAVISGRRLADVKERVHLSRLIYAGNHGLEIEYDDVSYVEPRAQQRAPMLHEISRLLAVNLGSLLGVRVEDKGLTISIHYRNATVADKVEAIERVTSAVSAFGDAIRMTTGHEVLEIRPRIDWDKGVAVAWICERLGYDRSVCIYIGDDATDEDAFRALTEGISIRVGGGVTRAMYQIADPKEVLEFLVWLNRRIEL